MADMGAMMLPPNSFVKPVCLDTPERPEGSGVGDEGHRMGGPLTFSTATGVCYCLRCRQTPMPVSEMPNKSSDEPGSGTDLTSQSGSRE